MDCSWNKVHHGCQVGNLCGKGRAQPAVPAQITVSLCLQHPVLRSGKESPHGDPRWALCVRPAALTLIIAQGQRSMCSAWRTCEEKQDHGSSILFDAQGR